MARNGCVEMATESNLVPIHRQTKPYRCGMNQHLNNKKRWRLYSYATSLPSTHGRGSMDDVFGCKYKSTSCLCGMPSC